VGRHGILRAWFPWQSVRSTSTRSAVRPSIAPRRCARACARTMGASTTSSAASGAMSRSRTTRAACSGLTTPAIRRCGRR